MKVKTMIVKNIPVISLFIFGLLYAVSKQSIEAVILIGLGVHAMAVKK